MHLQLNFTNFNNPFLWRPLLWVYFTKRRYELQLNILNQGVRIDWEFNPNSIFNEIMYKSYLSTYVAYHLPRCSTAQCSFAQFASSDM